MADHDKTTPETLTEYQGYANHNGAPQPDHMQEAEEVGPAEEGEHRGGLRDTLSERHVNMIAFSGTIGIGIFLSSGSILHTAGPGGAILAYILTATIVWSAIASLGEMTALMPVKGPITEFPARYLDNAVGCAVGWMYWFAYVSAFAAQTTASSSLIQFNYDNVLEWTFGIKTHPAMWIILFWLYMMSINLLPVKWLGEFEYFCGCLKMIVLSALILLMVIITNGDTSLPHGEKIGARYWHYPWGFFSRDLTVTNNNETFTYTGSTGRFLSLWTAMTSSIFSYVGMDLVAVTAAETKGFGDSESIKIATRKISLRVIIFYFLASVAVSFPVAYDDAHLLTSNRGLASAASSPFTIAIYNAGIPVLPHILNAFLIFSSTATGVSGLYGASRTLHALAASGRVLDGPIARGLLITPYGVPVVAVLASGIFGLLALMSISSGPAKVLNGCIANSSVSIMLVYMVLSLTFLSFYKGLGQKLGRGDKSSNYRKEGDYPYKSHFQWYRAVYAGLGCFLFLFFNGWQSFLGGSADTDVFVPSYISIAVFVFLVIVFKLNMILRHGGTFRREPTNLYDNEQKVEEQQRRGRFRKSSSFGKEVIRVLGVWLV